MEGVSSSTNKSIKFIPIHIPHLLNYSVSMVDGKVYILGGVFKYNGTVTDNDRIFIYDISTEEWSIHNLLLSQPFDVEGILVPGDGYINIVYHDRVMNINESTVTCTDIDLGINLLPTQVTYADNVGIFCIDNNNLVLIDYMNNVIPLPAPPIDSIDFSVTAVGSYLYKLGGRVNSTNPISEIEIFDIERGTWLCKYIDNLPREIYGHHSTQYADTKIIVNGGSGSNISPNVPIVYDTCSGNCTEIQDLMYSDITGYDTKYGPWVHIRDIYQDTIIIYE